MKNIFLIRLCYNIKLFRVCFSYKLRIECMLLKEEWAATSGYLESAINAILVAGDDLMSSRALQVYYNYCFC